MDTLSKYLKNFDYLLSTNFSKGMLLNVEELLSIGEFEETGSTDQLLAPDLTNLSQVPGNLLVFFS